MPCTLELSPAQASITRKGGLPDYICRVATHIHANGLSVDEAVPAAVNFCEFMCNTGQSKNFLKGNPTHTVSVAAQDAACAALADWRERIATGKALDTIGAVADTHAKFQADSCLVDAKAVESDGDLIIEGLASDWGIDRDGEAFEDGAFDRGLKAYLTMNPVLCYHHDPSRALGQVLEARRDEKGLHIKARIDKPAPGSWAEDIYEKVKRGTIRALSVGGIFKRRLTAAGPRIHDVDLTEISVTPVPVNQRTMFAVAGKAFGVEDFDVDPDADEFTRLARVLDELEKQITPCNC